MEDTSLKRNRTSDGRRPNAPRILTSIRGSKRSHNPYLSAGPPRGCDRPSDEARVDRLRRLLAAVPLSRLRTFTWIRPATNQRYHRASPALLDACPSSRAGHEAICAARSIGCAGNGCCSVSRLRSAFLWRVPDTTWNASSRWTKVRRGVLEFEEYC